MCARMPKSSGAFQGTKQITKMNANGFLKVFICLYLMHICTTFKIDDSHMDQWVTKFQGVLESHVSDVLAYSQIQDMLRKYENDLVIAPIDGQTVFEDLYKKVNIKYSDVLLAVNNLKASLEASAPQADVPRGVVEAYNVDLEKNHGNMPELDSQVDVLNDVAAPGAIPGPPPLGPGVPGAIPGRPLSTCCSGRPWKYNGRFRQEVSLYECYDKVDDELKLLATDNFTRTLSSNYHKYPVITWQYFADDAGHFIQYPASNRLCDRAMPTLISPLTTQWFVEKLHMERKNLVILFGIGKSTDMSAGPGTPRTRREVIIDAVQQALGTLTSKDKVNIVAIPSASGDVTLPPKCNRRLMMASQRNVAYLKDFTKTIPAATDEPSMMVGLRKVYTLLQSERTHTPSTFDQRSNIVLIVLDDQSSPFGTSKAQLLQLVARYQHELDNSVQHFVYVLGNSTNNTDMMDILAQIADQNNMKLNISSGIPAKPWPPLVFPNQTIGKEGVMEIVADPREFPGSVAAYFRRLPPQVDSEINLILPVLDRREGVTLTLAAPVYNKVNNTVVGVAAVDSTLARLFSDVTSCDVGDKSYAFLLDVTHGHVLLHPKLRDPAESYYDDTVFPQLAAVEPDLNTTEISLLLKAPTRPMQWFNTTMREATPLMEGELLADIGANRNLVPATVYYQRLPHTTLCLVLVHYYSDVEEEKRQQTLVKEPLHAPYHRIDKLMMSPVTHKPDPTNVCELNGNYVSFKESVVKLSPWVFADTESYKYNPESFSDINETNSFIIEDADTDLIKDEYKSLIQHTVRATNELDTIWRSHAKEIVERFYGSPFGVFRLYPGVPMENTFDHVKTEWYKRSTTMPDKTVYHYGKLSWLNREDVVIVTKSLVEQGRHQGVTGMTMTPRFLTSQLINTVPECTGGDIQCHILDSSGQIIDSLMTAVTEKARHVSKAYPGLTAHLLQNAAIQIDWCTAFSDGYHKALFSLVGSSSDITNTQPCLQYSIRSVPKTNLVMLIVANRTNSNCDNVSFKTCSSCQNPLYNPQYQLKLPVCEYCLSNSTAQCQCPCYCDSDFDQCDGQYDLHSSFPTDDCFYPPFHDSEKYFKPDPAGPGTAHCPLPCVAISDLEVCASLKHCKLSPGIYPTCIWKEDNELNNTYSYFFPTTTPRPPPTPPGLPTHSKTIPTVPTPPKLVTLKHTTKDVGGQKTTTTIPTPVGLSTKPWISTKAVLSTNPVLSTKPGVSTKPSLSVKPVAGGNGTTPTKQTVVHRTTAKVKPKPAGPSTSGSAIPTISSSSAATTVHHIKGGQQTGDDGGMSNGAIAALSIGLIALTSIVVFVVIKMKGKKFRRPGAAESNDKYVSGSGLFDSSMFNKSRESVTIGTAPLTTIPYQEM